MPQHSASILWSPPHTPGLGTLSANLVVLQIDVRHGLVHLQCLGQGLEAATYQGRRLVRGLYGQNKMTFHWDMWISLIQDLANNPEINSCLQPLHIWQLSSIRDEWWNYSTSKQTKFLSVKKNVKDMTWIHAAAFNGDNRTPGLGTLGTNVVVFPVDVHDGLVDLQCLGQGLEAATDQGWRLDFKRSTDKTLDLKSSDQRTFNLTKTCKSLWLNPCKNTPEINSSLQHLHIWQLSLRWKMNDETTGPPNHPNLSLSQDVENITSWDAAAFSDSAAPIPHTRPWPPRRQSGSISNECSWRTSLSSAPRPRPGNGDRARLASSSRVLLFKSLTFNSDMWISLIQNFASKAEIDSCLQHLHIWQLSLRWKMNDETTAPPNHPNLSLSKDVGDMTSWHAAAFSDSEEPTTHQALAPSSPIWFHLKSIFATDAFIFSASAKAWKRRQSKAGVFIQGSTVQIVITEIRRTHDI